MSIVPRLIMPGELIIQLVAQVFNLCKRRLKPAATKNHLMIATRDLCESPWENSFNMRQKIV
jgi:hypothetical protein